MGKLADRFSAWLAEGEAIRLDVAALENASAPVPAPPAPEPQPTPPAPIPAGKAPTIHTEPINSQRVVWPTAWAWSANYSRWTELVQWQPGSEVSIEYQRGRLRDPAVPGTPLDLPAHTYTLLIDGAPAATAEVAEGVRKVLFRLTAPTSPGWKTLTIFGLADGESQITYFALVPGAQQTVVPAVQSSHELSQQRDDYAHAWAWIDAAAQIVRPTPDHTYDPVTTEAQQAVDMLAVGDRFVPSIPARLAGGEWCTAGWQAYFWDDVIRQVPRVHLKDGPRGTGTVCFATHIEIGKGTQTADPASASRRNHYVCQPWRVVRVSNTGHVTTLVGLRHATGAGDVPAELVGDWSSIPEERRGLWLPWGMCWDSRTTLHNIDTSAAPIPAEENRQPHKTGPRGYIADSRWDRIVRAEFDGRSHATPAKVSEVFTGGGVWDCVEDESTNTMIVSQRDLHRVVRMTFDGEVLETLIARDPSLPGDAATDARHIARVKSGTLPELQAQPIVSPEGLYLLDGLLYVGSLAQRQITVIDLETGGIVRRVPVVVTGNSMFVKLAVSDGSYAPRGTIFYCTFDVSNGARWFGIKPDGSRWNSGSGSVYGLEDYQMAVGIGGGRMVVGGSDYGLYRHFNGPRIDATLYKAGEREFYAKHLRVGYGPHGVGPYALPDAAGEALRYFVACNYGGVN